MIKLPHDHGQALEPILSQLPPLEAFAVASDCFKQLSDPTRLRIFWLLCQSEICVINISSILEMSSPAVSHHLRQLRDAKLISSRRQGKEVYYHVDLSQDKCRFFYEVIQSILPNEHWDAQWEDPEGEEFI